jgi:hypothetical protein
MLLDTSTFLAQSTILFAVRTRSTQTFTSRNETLCIRPGFPVRCHLLFPSMCPPKLNQALNGKHWLLGRINRLLSVGWTSASHRQHRNSWFRVPQDSWSCFTVTILGVVLSVWYETDCIGNAASNRSSIVACVFVALGKCLSSRCPRKSVFLGITNRLLSESGSEILYDQFILAPSRFEA